MEPVQFPAHPDMFNNDLTFGSYFLCPLNDVILLIHLYYSVKLFILFILDLALCSGEGWGVVDCLCGWVVWYNPVEWALQDLSPGLGGWS